MPYKIILFNKQKFRNVAAHPESTCTSTGKKTKSTHHTAVLTDLLEINVTSVGLDVAQYYSPCCMYVELIIIKP